MTFCCSGGHRFRGARELIYLRWHAAVPAGGNSSGACGAADLLRHAISARRQCAKKAWRRYFDVSAELPPSPPPPPLPVVACPLRYALNQPPSRRVRDQDNNIAAGILQRLQSPRAAITGRSDISCFAGARPCRASDVVVVPLRFCSERARSRPRSPVHQHPTTQKAQSTKCDALLAAVLCGCCRASGLPQCKTRFVRPRHVRRSLGKSDC